MKAFDVEDGGVVVTRNLTWIGEVTAVKKSTGTGKDLVETTVYNFMLKSGFQAFKTVDFPNKTLAEDFRQKIIMEVCS